MITLHLTQRTQYKLTLDFHFFKIKFGEFIYDFVLGFTQIFTIYQNHNFFFLGKTLNMERIK